MKNAITFFILGFILMSCAPTYRYYTVDSSELDKDEHQNIIYQTDSLSINYSFEGSWAPIQLEVINNDEKPLFIDWSRSALIIKGKRYPFYQNTGDVNLRSRTDSYASSQTSILNEQRTYTDVTSYTHLRGTISYPESISFIPPRAYETKSNMKLFNKVRIHPVDRFTDNVETIYGRARANIETFDAYNADEKFRIYLTLSYDGQMINTFNVDHTFYISDKMDTKAMPNQLRENNSNNRGYVPVKEESSGGAGVLLLSLVFTSLLIMSAQL